MKLSKIILLVILSTVVFISCDKTKAKEDAKEVKQEDVETKTEVEIPNQKLTAEQQIASAVLAAPAETRDGAKVYGYDDDGKFTTLRESTNNMICIADDPNKDGFQVVAYHEGMEPFMARGRALKAEGKEFGDVRAIRETEAKEGKLQMPKNRQHSTFYRAKMADLILKLVQM